MKVVTDISRYIVGLLFIFSGLVKAVDPLGFSYKLTEYFEVFASPPPQMEAWSWISVFPWHYMEEYALPIAIFLVVLEIVLGVAAITGYKIKLTAWALLGLILFFSALTFASAQYEIVKTCGCFGDAIPLDPWESFYKDCILTFFVLIIFISRNGIQPGEVSVVQYVISAILLGLLGWLSFGRLEWGFTFWFPLSVLVAYFLFSFLGVSSRSMYVTLGSLVLITGFTMYCYMYLPVKDFRAYAVGKNLPEQMIGVPDSLSYTYVLKNKTTGENEDFKKFPDNYQQNYDYVEAKTEIVVPGIPPKIQDFSITDPYNNDATEEFLSNDSVYRFLLIEYDLSKSNIKVQAKANVFAEKAIGDGHTFVALTATPNSVTEKFSQDNSSTFDYYFTDGTVLKTIVRANPGLLLIRNGVVLGKWHHNSFPEYESVKAKYLSEE